MSYAVCMYVCVCVCVCVNENDGDDGNVVVVVCFYSLIQPVMAETLTIAFSSDVRDCSREIFQTLHEINIIELYTFIYQFDPMYLTILCIDKVTWVSDNRQTASFLVCS